MRTMRRRHIYRQFSRPLERINNMHRAIRRNTIGLSALDIMTTHAMLQREFRPIPRRK